MVVGAVAGYFGGWVDRLLMRAAELFQTTPTYLGARHRGDPGPTLTNIVIAIGIVSWTTVARMARAEFLSLRDPEFVQAARSLGIPARASSCGRSCPTRCRR